MARPKKKTVDYFPHYMPGDTMEFIRRKWGNDGYATWFILLEELAGSRNHFIELDTKRKKLLASKCMVEEKVLVNILDELADWGKINPELWNKEDIIFSKDFRESILDAYKRREENPATLQQIKNRFMGEGCAQKPHIENNNPVNEYNNGVNAPQKPTKESKVNKSKQEHTKSAGARDEKNYQTEDIPFNIKKLVNFWNSKENLISQNPAFATHKLEIIRSLVDNGWERSDFMKAISNLNDLLSDESVIGTNKAWTLFNFFEHDDGDTAYKVANDPDKFEKESKSGSDDPEPEPAYFKKHPDA